MPHSTPSLEQPPRWQPLLRRRAAASRSPRQWCGVAVRAVLDVGQRGIAVVGLLVVAALMLGVAQPPVRHGVESSALAWLQERQEQREADAGDAPAVPAEPGAVQRATAADVATLPAAQARLATWIARRYRVAVEPVSALVREAWAVGPKAGVDPTLVLAVMAVESRFNPFAQSPVGAQGLMQVMTRVHDDKYDRFGGVRAAFDPVTNLRVGVQVLRDCIARAGGVTEGLRHYVGAALLDDDGGYAERVLAEQRRMQRVAAGRAVAVTVADKPMARPVSPLPRPTPEAATAPAQEKAAAVEQVALLR